MTYWINEKLGVISLFESMTEEGVVIVDVRNISDVESDVIKVVNRINVITSLICIGERIAVRCFAGINRSCAIALGVMCYMDTKGDINETWDFHYKILKSKVGRAMITPELERTVKAALKRLDGRYNRKI